MTTYPPGVIESISGHRVQPPLKSTPQRHRRKRWLNRRRNWLRYELPTTLARLGIIGPLPNFLIIGTQRGGTTYLHELLMDHPQVATGFVKEVHFFERHFYRGLDWYRANFALGQRAPWHRGSAQRISGEATADYLFGPCVPRRVHEAIPEAKLIVLLRNPIDRAFSHYQLSVKIGVEHLTFEEAIEAEGERLGVPPGHQWPEEVEPDISQFNYAYLSKGLYADQLRRWMNVFPSEQLLIIGSDRLYARTPEVLDEVAEFLHLPRWRPRGGANINSLSYSSMKPETRQTLLEFYRPHNQSLYQLLNNSFDWDDD